MEFLSLKDHLEEFGYSHDPVQKITSGAKIFGTVLANVAIGAGKVAAEVVERLPAELEKQKNKANK